MKRGKNYILALMIVVILCCSFFVIQKSITGKITFVGPYKVYEGKSKDIKVGDNSYNIRVKSVINSDEATISIDNNDNVNIQEGINNIENLQIKVVEINNKKDTINSPFVKFSVAESDGISKSSEVSEESFEKPAESSSTRTIPTPFKMTGKNYISPNKNWVSCQKENNEIVAKYKYKFLWTTKTKTKTYQDSCLSDNNLRDYSCDGKKPYYNEENCENGCNGGECILEESKDCTIITKDGISNLIPNKQCAPSLNDKPKYCINGEVIDNCKECGCTPYNLCQEDGTCIKQCQDKTIDKTCSLEKPLYCDNFELKHDCKICDCNKNEICQTSGYCAQGEGPTFIGLVDSEISEIIIKGFSYNIRADLEDDDGIDYNSVKAIIYNNQERYEINLNYLKGDLTFGAFAGVFNSSIAKGNEFSIDIYAKDLSGNSALIKNASKFKLINLSEFSCNNVLYNGNNKINIVFVADEIDNFDTFNKSVYEKIDLLGEDKGLFSVEPFKSNRDQFNIYSIYSKNFFRCIQPFLQDWPYYLEDNNLGCNQEFIKELAKKVCNIEKVDQLNVISGINSPLGRAHADIIGDFSTSSILMPPYEFIHEFGHSFGNLGDEYFAEQDKTYLPISDLSTINIDSEGCSSWCSGELNTNSKCYPYYIEWKKCVNGISIENEDKFEDCWYETYNKLLNKEKLKLDECNLGLDCKTGTGCFFTAHGVNGWRQVNNSIMRHPDQNPFVFGPISEEAIIQKINGKLINQ